MRSLLCFKGHAFRLFTTSRMVARNPPRFKSKGTKRTPIKHIQTPEELLQQASSVDIDNLKRDVDLRYNLRYTQPNLDWIKTQFPNLSPPSYFNGKDNKDNREFILNHLIKTYGDINTSFNWKDFQYNELNIGDLVDLSGNFEKNDLAVVIELPQSPDDPRYTLVNAYGEIQFVSRSKMGLKIPNVFPKKWFQNVLMEEIQSLPGNEDVQPIGKPKYKLEELIDRNKMFESVAARSLNGENSPKTFVIPSILAGIISRTITDIIIKSWNILPEVNLKLEILHNVLQSHESPIQLSLYQLFKAVGLTDLNEVNSMFQNQSEEGVNYAYKKLLLKISEPLSINNQYNTISLGKSVFGSVSLEDPVNVNDFYAFILGLRKNNKVYIHDSFSHASTFVLITPLARVVQFNKMVKSFKSNQNLYKETANFITIKLNGEKLTNEPIFYKDFIELLKLMCGGSIYNNVLESFVLRIIRMLPPYNNLDITSSCIYDLLLNLREISNSEDPTKWWDTAMIPNSGTSVKSDYEQNYYDFIKEENINDYVDLTYDSFGKERKEFDDLIYCIDSKNPLEIDDGISIKKLNEDEFIVSTFVADPSSYLQPDNLISKIAFDRGLTLYLPDLSGTNAIPLLPNAFSKEIQLGYFGKKTRVFKVSFQYNINTSQYSELKEGIDFGYASKFVKIDYSSTNKVLSGNGDEILNEISNSINIPKDNLSDDLKNLSIISQKLNEVASKNGRASLFDKINIKKEIENIEADENQNIHLKFKDMHNDDNVIRSIQDGTRSEQLVSEIMVMTNYLTAKFLQSNEIPAIYKIQQKLAKSAKVEKFTNEIMVNSDATFKDLTLFQEYLTKSTISPFCAPHEFLNIESYATVTSPLRRFSDFVNHWQLQAFICNGDVIFSQEEINYLSLQLKFKDELNSKISKKVIGFFTFKALKQLQKEKFQVIVTKKPTDNGLVDVMMMDYGVRCVLETSRYALSERKANPVNKNTAKSLEIGDLIDDAQIKDIDLLDGSILMQCESL